MKFIIDLSRIREGIKNGIYDERGLSKSKSGKHHFPSKKMIYDWLRMNYGDVIGTAEIWSEEDWDKNEVTVCLEIKYKVPNLPKKGVPLK